MSTSFIFGVLTVKVVVNELHTRVVGVVVFCRVFFVSRI